MAKKPKRLSAKALKEMNVQGQAMELMLHGVFTTAMNFVMSVPAEPDSDFADLQFDLAVMQGESAARAEEYKKKKK